jgi:hypothetical protein
MEDAAKSRFIHRNAGHRRDYGSVSRIGRHV